MSQLDSRPASPLEGDATLPAAARASLTSLPLELKEKIVKMASAQEEAWNMRVCPASKEEADHINSLSSLALVNKEFRELAAKHQFKVLKAHQASLPAFRYLILPSYADCFTKVDFYLSEDHGELEESEEALLSIPRLPSLCSLSFSQDAATALFGLGVTLESDPTDVLGYSRIKILLSVLHEQIRTLVLTDFSPSASVALIRACPNLTTLGLYNMDLGDTDQGGLRDELWNAIASARKLTDLTILANDGSLSGIPDALARDPPPLQCLQLLDFPFENHTFEFIRLFSTTIKRLSLDLKARDLTLDIASITLTRLPHLTHLSLLLHRQRDLGSDLHPFSPLRALRHLSLHYHDSSVDPADPALISFLTCQPFLRRAKLGTFEPRHLYVSYDDVSETYSSSTDADWKRRPARLGSSQSFSGVLEQTHPSPFHPDANLDYASDNVDNLREALDRTLDFGKIELERMIAEGNVAKAVGWVETLRPLEDERLAWKD
ncbi:hypothetical protein RQP46_003778 [Phenoliferia psychrophenolica]